MTTADRSRWRRRHAEELGRYALREAGKRSHVATALGRALSTISHEVKDRCHPVLAEAFEILLDLERHPDTGARSFATAVEQAITLSEIRAQSREAFIARGCWLLDAENESCGTEDTASMVSQAAHAAALLKHGSHVMELAAYLTDAERRGIDLHTEWRSPARQASRNGASPRKSYQKVAKEMAR